MLRLLSEVKIEDPIVDENILSDYRIPETAKYKLTQFLGDKGYGFDSYTSFSITDKAKSGKPANYAILPNQYFLYACKMHDFAVELYKYFIIFDKVRPYANQLVGSASQIIETINSNGNIRNVFDSERDIELFAKFIDKNDASYRLGAKKLMSEDGKPRGSKDCFGSALLKKINLPDASSSIFGDLVYYLCSHIDVYDHLASHYKTSLKHMRSSSPTPNEIFYLPKPFLLLAGISGTGKTRFVREQAKAMGSFQETYCLTSVRPDWHEPSDLLGYISRLDGKEKYITTDVLQFIAKAWRAMVDAGLSIETQAFDNQGECLVVSGERDALNGVLPYWLCLDEMNLAPVEQYFADYLSVLETRAWHWDGNSFTYTCDALLKPTTIQAVADNSKLRSDLGFGNAKYDAVWALIGKHGLSIPFNLMVAGTVNMDETTHGFSRKVIDRALSFDFGEFFPNDYDAFFESSHQPKTLSYPLWSHANPEYLKKTFDTDGQKSIAFLTAVNAVLKNTPFELAYRALNELLLSVASAQPKDQTTLAAVWDDFLMCKVLPRIEGDVDKLSSGATSVEAYGQQTSILQRLEAVLAEELELVWSEAGDSPQARPDLYREHKATDEQMIRIACRSRTKLQWMQARLTSAGFTSFWP